MRRRLKHAALNVLAAVPARDDADGVAVLCYHAVPSREGFREQMALLASSGREVLSLHHFQAWLRGEAELRRPGVLLTFDDCYLDQFENAVAVLEACDFSALFFAVSDRLGGRSDWWHEFTTEATRPLMDATQLRELHRHGFVVGCHSRSHARLTRLRAADLDREIRDAKRQLEELLGVAVTTYCYPYGEYDETVAAAVRDAGFDLAFTVRRGFVRRGEDPYRLSRLPILGEPRGLEFRSYLSGAMLRYWKLRRLVQR